MHKISMMTFLIILLLSSGVCAVTPCQLFVIERSKNANLVIYEAQLDDAGTILPTTPVVAYWKLNATTGGKEALGMLDKKAYGFSVNKEGDIYRMVLAPVKKRPILLVNDGNTVRAQMVIGEQQSWLSKVYVKAKEGAFLPTVQYFELFGTAVAGGQTTYEKIVP
ncbi:MAG: DUF4833 domain-containing protein [Elusimicrobia bacterium]|nr:DUF4833 domain-containing protein [Elusimicrobiota bacterium]